MLGELLDKPWSQVSHLLPPRYVPKYIFAHEGFFYSAFPPVSPFSSDASITRAFR